MRVIGASWGRTGTTTAAAALDVLGLGPTVQMQTMWQEPDLAAAWAGYYAGEEVDWPGCWEWQTFADLWPDAVVLLTTRDASSWYDSVRGSIHAWTAPGEDVGPPAVAALLDRVWNVDFDGWDSVFDRTATVARYDAHVAHVRSTCPPDRLVEWSVADGWQPLCAALGIAVPEVDLPHLNRR